MQPSNQTVQGAIQIAENVHARGAMSDNHAANLRGSRTR
jgi:hypothetical protein